MYVCACLSLCDLSQSYTLGTDLQSTGSSSSSDEAEEGTDAASNGTTGKPDEEKGMCIVCMDAQVREIDNMHTH